MLMLTFIDPQLKVGNITENMYGKLAMSVKFRPVSLSCLVESSHIKDCPVATLILEKSGCSMLSASV